MALRLSALVIPGVAITGWTAAFASAALLGLLNAILWPLLVRFALPITVLTFGLGVLVLNGLIIIAVSAVLPGFEVSSIWSAIGLAFSLTFANVVGTTLLAIDDDDFYYRNVIRRTARRRASAIPSAIPGVVFMQIDGLGFEVLQRAIRDGDAPTMARWLRDGTHRLMKWETDWSSQTGASQAGLLQGSNFDMPAFRWWEKEHGRALVSNHPRDAMEIERRHSSGDGLLANNGASRGNVLSGDAPRSSLTMSTVLTRHREGRVGQAYYAYFANPYNLTRTILLALGEVLTERIDARRQQRRDVQPRIDRPFSYALLRAWTCVVQRDLQIETVIGDMYEGRMTVYTDILGYDEVAHHSGVERTDSLRVLRNIDHQLHRLERAAKEAPRPYRLVVLSDHGQSQGPTFRQRFGQTLEQLVESTSAIGEVHSEAQGDESQGYLDGSLQEASAGQGFVARLLKKVVRSDEAQRASTVPPLVVMASGNLGLIYFARRPGRLTLEEINRDYPRLVPSLRVHPGIGFILIRSAADGALVVAKDGTRYLESRDVDGSDPLKAFGVNAVRHLRRSDGFPHVADIMVNSAVDEETGDVFAFEELVGSHGGLGGAQSFPFLLVPRDWPLPAQPLVGAEAVHRQLKRWLAGDGRNDTELASSGDPDAKEPSAGSLSDE